MIMRRGFNLKFFFSLIIFGTVVSVVFVAFKVHIRNILGVHSSDVGAANNGPRAYNFDMRGHDVLVFVHIQKTGGSQFGVQLIKNLNIDRPCKCSRKNVSLDRRQKRTSHRTRKGRRVCHCLRPDSKKIWLFSRLHLGWPCGLHADWTEHRGCVPKYMNKREGGDTKRKFLFLTILREPVSRFLSEFCFVWNMGEQWPAATLRCNGRSPSKNELPPCFEFNAENLTAITMDEFMRCSSNLAINRQTRMIADLTLVNCYNTSGKSALERGKIMLRSAMKNLQDMAYFALVEFQQESQYLFERTFGLRFLRPFTQTTESETSAGRLSLKLNDSIIQRITDLNALDVEFYAFAKDLFFSRVKYYRELDNTKVK